MAKKPLAIAGDTRDEGSTLDHEDPWRRKWQPAPVFLPGEFYGQRKQATVHGVTKSWTQLSTHDLYLR